jgi:hypothetical protein
MLNAAVIVISSFSRGVPVDQNEIEIRQLVRYMRDFQQEVGLQAVLPIWQCHLNFIGEAAAEPTTLTGDAKNQGEFIEQAVANHNDIYLQQIGFNRMTLALFFNDLVLAESLLAC